MERTARLRRLNGMSTPGRGRHASAIMENRPMKYRVTAVAGVLVLAVAAVFAILGATNGSDDTSTNSGGDADSGVVQAASSPAPEQLATAIAAEPPAEPVAAHLVLS